MSQISLKPGDCLTVDGDIVIQVERICGGRAHLSFDALDDVAVTQGEKPSEDIPSSLQTIAKDVIAMLAQTDAASSQELLSGFVSDLFYAAAEQRRKEERRQKQAEGIAAAKAKGVRFGRTAKPVPENFGNVHRAWRNGEMSLEQAAEACGMARGTFYNIAVRREQAEHREAMKG